MISEFFADIYVSTVSFIRLSRQKGHPSKIHPTFNVGSNDSRHSMLATLFLFDFIADIRCYFKLNPALNVISSVFV